MAWVRQLPSGLWAATVRTPNGRITRTHRLKSRVTTWAQELEDDIRRGEFLDPRRAEHTVGECWERWQHARPLEKASRKRDESHWRCHVAPRWEHVQIGSILRPDIQAWVVEMREAGIGAATIEGSVGLLRRILDMAVDGGWLRTNPAQGVRSPRRPAHLDRVLAPEEDDLLLSALDRVTGGHPCGRLAGELLLYCGLRWEEMAALDREHVDTRRRMLHVAQVLERDGTIRPYPKTRAGARWVPIDDDLWPRVRDRVLAIGRGDLLITSPRGGVLDYSRWHDRVWTPALAGVPERPRVRGHAYRPAIPGARLADPQPTPHDLRHTYGTRLGEAGMPAHEIMALMGHESLASVQRYLHAGDGRYDRARRAVLHARRGQDHESLVSHDLEKSRTSRM